MEAGEQQIEASQKIEESYALLRQRNFTMPLPHHVDSSAMEDFPGFSGREYISAIEAAQVTLQNGPLDLHTLYERIISMGARCKNRMSLATMLRQHPEKFEYIGNKKWEIAGVHVTESPVNGRHQEDPMDDEIL